jgi:hypothetical protein
LAYPLREYSASDLVVTLFKRTAKLSFCLSVVIVVVCVLVQVTASATSSPDSESAKEPRRPFILFYANETTQQASSSGNYAALISALRQSSNPVAASIADSLLRDAEEYPTAIRRDAQTILDSAHSLGIDAAVFTNALALERRYLLFRATEGKIESRALPDLPPGKNSILANSPLSMSGSLYRALSEIGGLYSKNSLNVLLITASHGNDEMALMPRVFAEISQAHLSNLSALLDSAPAAESGAADGVSYQGTSKREYWRVIAEATASFGMRFPLVFRAACESGPSGLSEYFAVPGSVALIAHTRNDGLKYDQVDYAAAFGRISWQDLINHVTAQLSRDGIYVGSPALFGIWGFWSLLSRYYPALFFFPLLVWLCMIVPSLVKSLERNLHVARQHD